MTERLIDILVSRFKIMLEKLPMNKYTPYQLCPKCNGDGDLGRFNSPPFMSTGWPPICDVCNGSKIIPMHTLSNLEAKEGRV